MRQFLVLSPIVLVVGLFQNTNVFSIFGIKPNLLLALLVPAAFFLENILTMTAILAIALFLSDFRSGFTSESASLAVLALVAPALTRRLPWEPFVNNIVLMGAMTVIFYLLASPSYLIHSPIAILFELLLNITFSAIFYNLFNSCLKTSSMLRT